MRSSSSATLHDRKGDHDARGFENLPTASSEFTHRMEELVDLYDGPSHSLTSTPGIKTTLPTLMKRVGRSTLAMNVAAVALLAMAIPALTFLWFCNDSNKVWRRIMIDGGLAQAVTVLTLTVRLAVATQAGTVISMLASILLESRELGGISLKDGAALSITRYVNSGPLSTAPAFWKNTQWRANGQVFLIVLSVTLFTVVSQFTSTLLLWDVRQGNVLDFSDQRQMDVGFRMQSYVEKFGFVITRSPNYWLSSPPGYPAFAEHSKKPASTSDVFVDTGPSIRALLPFSSENDRRALSEYTGLASVFDTRVICVRPEFPSWSFFRNSTDDVNVAIFNGTVLPSSVVGDVADVLRYENKADGSSFECLLNELLLQDDQSFKICGIGVESGGLISSVDMMQNTTLGYTYDSASKQWRAQNKETAQTWPVELGHAILIISAGDPGTPKSQTDDSDLRYLASSLPINEPTTNFTIHEREAWLDFVPNQADESMMSVHHPKANISMTMCYDAM